MYGHVLGEAAPSVSPAPSHGVQPRRLEFADLAGAATTPAHTSRSRGVMDKRSFSASESEEEPAEAVPATAVVAAPTLRNTHSAPRPLGIDPECAEYEARFKDILRAPRNLDSNAKVMTCCVCSAISSEVRWYVVLSVRGSGGAVLHRPDGDLCFRHGAAVTVYPLMSTAQTLNKYDTDPVFHRELEIVSYRCVDFGERMFAMMSVLPEDFLACECFIDVGAVPIMDFTAKWVPPVSIKIPVTFYRNAAPEKNKRRSCVGAAASADPRGRVSLDLPVEGRHVPHLAAPNRGSRPSRTP